ncbi:MAG TPA: hypothetical protein VN328_09705 [Thermodesulfovibrionales bacterium]|nr:hypothetical protein [Thermodesulfovibrionales bacterium]
MYIKKEDFSYFEGLHKSLDEEEGKKFLDILVKQAGRRVGEDVSKIQVVGDEIFDSRGIEPQEFVTRTMIKKAYKEAKEGK